MVASQPNSKRNQRQLLQTSKSTIDLLLFTQRNRQVQMTGRIPVSHQTNWAKNQNLYPTIHTNKNSRPLEMTKPKMNNKNVMSNTIQRHECTWAKWVARPSTACIQSRHPPLNTFWSCHLHIAKQRIPLCKKYEHWIAVMNVVFVPFLCDFSS